MSFSNRHWHRDRANKRSPLWTTVSSALLIGSLSTASVVVGVLGDFSPQTTSFSIGAPAFAQDEVAQYARAAFEVEQLRQRKYGEAKRALGGNMPGNVCQQQNIPDRVRDICSQLQSGSTAIIQRNGLTVQQFNDITRRKASDPGLQQRIQAELIRLQGGR